MQKQSAHIWRSSKEDYRLVVENIHGAIESFTSVHNAPDNFEENTPYVIALIALDNGEKMIAQVVSTEKVYLKMRVEPCVRILQTDGDEGLIKYGTKFKPVK